MPRTLLIMTPMIAAIGPAITAAQVPIAFDNAAAPQYADGWQSGDNGGYGFAPWVLTDGAFEIRSSTLNNSIPPPPPGGDIDSPGTGAWALTKHSMDSQVVARASRHLLAPLQVGQTLSFDYDTVMPVNFVSGIALLDDAGTERLRLSFHAAYFYVNGVNGGAPVVVGGKLSQNGIHFDFTLTAPDSYALAYDSPAQPSDLSFGTPDGVITATLAGTPGGSIEQLMFDRTAFGGDPRWYAYVNNLAVTPEPGALATAALGLITFLARRGR